MKFAVVTSRLALAVVLGAAGMGLVACGESATVDASPSASSSGAADVAVGQYKAVDKLCDYVDLKPILAVLPTITEELASEDGPADGIQFCSGDLGTGPGDDEQGTLNLYLEVFDDTAAAKAHFDYFYDNNKSISGAKPLAGIGQEAYTCAVPSTGTDTPTVRVLDGNAVLTAEWMLLTTSEVALPSGLYEALTETLRTLMANLQKA
jgi:hypothetical protein